MQIMTETLVKERGRQAKPKQIVRKGTGRIGNVARMPVNPSQAKGNKQPAQVFRIYLTTVRRWLLKSSLRV